MVCDEINAEMEGKHLYITVYTCLLNLMIKTEGVYFVHLWFFLNSFFYSLIFIVFDRSINL